MAEIRDLLICETNNPALRNIFFLQKRNGDLAHLQCLNGFEMPLTCLNINRKLDALPQLPNEMVINILKITIDYHLENSQFGKAYHLMCSCRAVFCIYFDRYVGRQNGMCLFDKIKYLRSTMRLASRLSDLYTEPNRFMPSPDVFTVNLHLDTYLYRNLDLLNVKTMSYSYQDIYHPLRTCEFKKIHTDVRPCDNVWLFGKQGKQFFHCVKMYRPALVFMLEKRYKHTNGYFLTETVYPNWNLRGQVRPLELFGDLMRKVFGPETGVFFISGASDTDFEKFVIREV